MKYVRWIVCVSLLCVAPAAFADEENSDPWESFNRSIYSFNSVLDGYVLRPVAVGYRAITPDFLEDGIANFFSNAAEILTILNDILQGKFAQSGEDSLRFIVNSTVGIGGFIDIGSRIGLEKHKEDFGQTLAVWGVSDGPFVVLPFLGPRTLRDAFTYIPDSTLTLVNTVSDEPTQLGLTAMSFISLRAGLLDVESLAAGDKYSFVRDAYLQNRAFLVSDGQLSDEDLFDDGFEDDDFDE
ncbi:hypothetical protein A9Q99_26950 [Gammaproteobacteria bacterium 45_16_T64]|nr:hypothetical protein A9Q99_26950 [Gammaproteobacteria bacterium 45_16_T64]